VILTSESGEGLDAAALTLESQMRGIEGIADPRLATSPPSPELVVRPRPDEASRLGVSADMIAEAIQSYPGLPHRQAKIAEIDGISFINDSKATNADAASRAMGCYDRFIWIAGGAGKAGGIESLAAFFPRVQKAFLIGQDGAAFAETLQAHGVANDVVATLEAAVPLAFAAAKQGGIATVLFSPAAASFDQFSNFEVRGERFAELAGELR